MAEQLPTPLVPPEVDLRGMEFMPLFGNRLFKSTTWIEASPEGQVAALRLWWHSYAHEVPAASLPDNDRLLAEHAGYGVAVRAFQKIKAQALRGWLLCSDGRWYHKVVADLALEAWAGRVRNREKIRKWREKKDAANRSETGSETVTATVTNPVGNGREGEGEGERQRELQRQRQLPTTPSLADSAPARDAEPIASGAPDEDPLEIPPFLQRGSRAKFIEPDWQPSDQALAQLRKSRPDITPETLERRMVEFRTWCAANAKQTFNPDATWLGFMVKTHAERPRDQTSERSVSAGLAGFAEAGSR